MFVRAANDPLQCSSVVLFQASGSDEEFIHGFRNTWHGWYGAGPTHSSGPGKRLAYDKMPISNLRLSDTSGRFVEYKLNKGYANRTLLSIVQGCMGSNRTNTDSSAWKAGLCSNVGTRTSYSGGFGSFSLSKVLRIGVGDGQTNSNDWALLMPLSGNLGDYNGRNAWVFGGIPPPRKHLTDKISSGDETNNGHPADVTISATCPGARFRSLKG